MPDVNGNAQRHRVLEQPPRNFRDLPGQRCADSCRPTSTPTRAHSLGIAGLSAGGTCASILTLTNPRSSRPSPITRGSHPRPTSTIRPNRPSPSCYGGSKANYEAHNPVALLTANKYHGLAGWFTAGQSDPPTLASMQRLSKLAERTGMQVCTTFPPGDHSFLFWSQAFADSLPWLSWRLGLTPPPKNVPAYCVPRVPNK